MSEPLNDVVRVFARTCFPLWNHPTYNLSPQIPTTNSSLPEIQHPYHTLDNQHRTRYTHAMKIVNPFLQARLRLVDETRATPESPEGQPMTLRAVADDLGVTWQFVQKVEEGLTGTAPESLSFYYTALTPPNVRLDWLQQLVKAIRTLNENSHNPIRIPRRFVYGTPQFTVPSVGALYTLWVIYERACLPNLNDILEDFDHRMPNSDGEMMTAQEAVGQMCGKVADSPYDTEKDGAPQFAYYLATRLKINPYIIQRWEKLDKQVPPTLRIAIAQTGRRGNE